MAKKKQPKMQVVSSPQEVTEPLTLDKVEWERTKASLKEWTASPEEHAEIIAKYGPPLMPLKDRRSVMHFNKKNGKSA